jgi:hypothetical protein
MAGVISGKAQVVRISGGGGYGWGRGADYYESGIEYDQTYEVAGKTDHYLSLGKGPRVFGAIELVLNRDLAVQLGAGYTPMPDLEVLDTWPNQIEPDRKVLEAHTIDVHALLTARFRIGKWSFYAGAGGGYFIPRIQQESKVYWWGGEDLDRTTLEIRAGNSLGLIGVLGVEIAVMERISFFTEARFRQTSFELKEVEVTRYLRGDEDVLDQVDLDPDTPGNQTVVKYERNSIRYEAPEMLQGSGFAILAGLRLSLFHL